MEEADFGDVTNLSHLVLRTIAAGYNTTFEDEYELYPVEWVIPVTVIYAVIFITGLIGNVSTCVVISRNKSLHTVTNYYLFSIAVSDLLLLISGLPPEMYRIWSPERYVFGEAFCVVQGFAAETSANATVLAITAFTVERYLAICHPFLSHTMSNLSRAIKFIVAIWVIALCLATPQALQFGVAYDYKNGVEYSRCEVVSTYIQHAFEISTFLIFVGPMTLITVLYVLIALKLRKSRMLSSVKMRNAVGGGLGGGGASSRSSRLVAGQNRVIKMLVAVVVAFFICWAPFHAQRLLAVYLTSASPTDQATSLSTYIALMYISGVLYFLSTTVNPVLYHIMSNKFREAFKRTYYGICGKLDPQDVPSRTYSVLSRAPPSLRNYQRSVSDGVQNGQQQLPLNQTPENNLQTTRRHKNNNTGSSIPTAASRVLSESSGLTTTVLTTLVDERKASQRHVGDDHNGRLGRIFRVFHRPKRRRRRHPQDDEALKDCIVVDTTNTISNSSLQDLEEIEFTNSDLVRYMEEVNDDLT